MYKQTIALIAGAAVCVGLLAVIGGKIYAASGKSSRTDPAQEEASETKTAGNEKAALVNKVISGMSSRAQAGVRIDDMDAFLSDLDRVLRFDASGAEDDIPLLTLADRQHPLPDGYAPKQLVQLVKNTDYTINRADLSLRPEASEALSALGRAARSDGVTLLVSSTYRSYEYQKTVYEKWVELDGQEEADRESARPGTSQHQLGTAADFGSISDDFAATSMGAWMTAHAAEYGWSLSFPQGYENVTGYRWESWHFRYVGKDACMFQKKYFSDIQQFMLEFVHAWKSAAVS
ncbi:MAG TPA: peptidase M15 [Treponema sp.]|nr:peptidase M15 [Treponema sp.]